MHIPRVIGALLLGLLAGGPSFADDSPSTAAPARSEEPEPVVASAAVAAPRWTASGVFDSAGYRMSLSRGAVDLGMRFEARTIALRPTEPRTEPTTLTLPAVSLELRSVSALPTSASSLAERALGGAEGKVSKLGIEWKPAQSQVFFRQGLGVRFNGDDSVVMRLRKGMLGIYMHRSF